MMTKQEIRNIVKARRALASRDSAIALADAREALSICQKIEAMPEFRSARTVLSYSPLPGEVDVRGINTDGKELVLADCPWEQIPASAVDFAIIPGVAFSLDGSRLGRGGGYYDRLLPLLRCKRVAPAFHHQIFDSIPMDKWDRKVDQVVVGQID